MLAPAPVVEPLVERDRGILALAHVEIEDREACGACRILDRDRQRPRQAVAARPGRHEGGRQGAGMGLCLVVAARLDELGGARDHAIRSEEHTSELQSLMRISYAVFCLK